MKINKLFKNHVEKLAHSMKKWMWKYFCMKCKRLREKKTFCTCGKITCEGLYVKINEICKKIKSGENECLV